MSRPQHDSAKTTPAVQAAMAKFHADVVSQVANAVATEKVVVVGMAWNPHCKKAVEYMTKNNIKHTYLEFGSYAAAWKERLAIKMWSGWPTFPQIFLNGVLVGGFSDLEKGVADGSLKGLLE